MSSLVGSSALFDWSLLLNYVPSVELPNVTSVLKYWRESFSGHPFFYELIKAVIIVVSGLVLYKSTNFLIKKIAPLPLFANWPLNQILYSNRLYSNVVRYACLMLVIKLANYVENPQIEYLVILASRISIVFVAGAIAFSALDSALELLNSKTMTKKMPIKSLTQLGKVGTSIVCFVVIVSLMIDKSPAYLVGSLGALSAVLMLVFKDSILGLVHGIQLSANRIVSIGDRVQTGDIEGTVEDISLTVVKIRNYDRTITSIPCSELVSKPLKNWAFVHDKGSRIKRSISIDANSVKFISDDEVSRLSGLKPINGYLSDKFKELEQYNSKLTDEELINKRRLTNLGTFRIFIENYLKMHDQIITDETLVVRQGQSSEKGIPIEIYCFAKNNSWTDYEQVQSDIFDYIFAVIPLFGLRIFQFPTGYDLHYLSQKFDS